MSDAQESCVQKQVWILKKSHLVASVAYTEAKD